MNAVQPRRPSRNPTSLRVWLRVGLLLVCVCALGAPLTAGADPEAETTIAPALLDAAQANPGSEFKVIVQGETDSEVVAEDIESLAPDDTAVTQSFETVPAVAATLTGSEIVTLAQSSDPQVITRDTPVAAAEEPPPVETAPRPAGEEPTVTGRAEPGVSLTAVPGVWTGPGTPTYSFQWQRCSRAGFSEAVLAGSPLEYWSLGERVGDVTPPLDLGSPSKFSTEGWVKLAEPQKDRALIAHWRSPLQWWAGPTGGFKLYLDADVNKYLKDFQVKSTYPQPVTLRNIMTHTAGFEDGGVGYLFAGKAEDLIPLGDWVAKHEPARVRPPTTNWNESGAKSWARLRSISFSP